MKIKVYILSIIHTSNEDESCLDTYLFNNMEKAREKFKQEEDEWIKNRKIDMTEEEFSEWLEEALINDINHKEGMYRNYIYDGGDEKVFSIEMHEVEVA